MNPDSSWKELFFENAFLLYKHRNEIYEDSRLFFTPLPFENNLAYTGTSGLENPTLGIYLEWWDTCDRALIKEDGELVALTYYIAGSPLTGINGCAAVDENGRTRKLVFASPFSEIWHSFRSINQHYADAKHLYQTFSLKETVAKLKHGQ